MDSILNEITEYCEGIIKEGKKVDLHEFYDVEEIAEDVLRIINKGKGVL